MEVRLATGKLLLLLHSVGENESHDDMRFQGWENRLHFLVEGVVKSHCKGTYGMGARVLAVLWKQSASLSLGKLLNHLILLSLPLKEEIKTSIT